MTPPRLGFAVLLTALSMAGFACMDAMSKFLVRDYAIVQTLWVRYVIFTGFALLVARPVGVLAGLRSTRPWLQAGRGVLALVENGVFVLAFLYLPLADTHAVAATAPLMVIALSVPLLGEKAGLHRWLAVIAGFAGVLLIIRPGFLAPRWALLIPLGGAFLWAVYQVLTRLTARGDRVETTLLWTALSGLAGTTLLIPWYWLPPDATAWLLLGCVGVLGSLSHYALIKALDFAQAGAVQPYTYTLLVWATILGVLVFGDVPDAGTITGGGIVVLSGLYTWFHDRREERRP
jgi:drug/metabolite transporter (DMT)-like permease